MPNEWAWFLDNVPAGGAVLEAGCGSGRDALVFLRAGRAVTAFDGSAEMVRRASAHTGLPVRHMTFQEMDWDSAFDGVWASASLLHVPRAELPAVMQRIVRALKPRGVALRVLQARRRGPARQWPRLHRHDAAPARGAVRGRGPDRDRTARRQRRPRWSRARALDLRHRAAPRLTRTSAIKLFAPIAFALAAATSALAAPIATFVQAQGPANVPLGTMLSQPDAPKAPVVLIIPGSGPTDRDGNSPSASRPRPTGCWPRRSPPTASPACASTSAACSRAPPPTSTQTRSASDDYAADVHAWVAEVRRQTGAPCIWPLGHSEGALVAWWPRSTRPASAGSCWSPAQDGSWPRCCANS